MSFDAATASTRPKLHLRRCRMAVMFFLSLALVAFVPTKGQAQGQDNEWVEIRSNDDIYKPYSERRGRHGWQFGIHSENFLPKDWTSTIDGAPYVDTFGEVPVPIVVVEAGYKFNFMLGSLSLLVGYGQGSLDGEYEKPNGAGFDPPEARDILIKKNHASLMYIADNLMREPYVAPYFAFSMYKFVVDEGSPDAGITISGETAMGNQMTIGALIQMNWIEESVARWAWLGVGLENTYLDVFMTSFGATSDSNDPDTTSAMSLGFGIRLEF